MSDLTTTTADKWTGKRARKWTRLSAWVWPLLALGAIVFLAANAHLIYVATMSQPACVEHLRQGQGVAEQGRFAAAQSSCSPASAGRPGSP